jgi:deoxyribonuclease V
MAGRREELQHPWEVSPTEARAIQERLRRAVITRDELGPVRHVAGVDVGFEEHGALARAAVAVLTFPELILVESAVVRRAVAFPYVPGLLSFREAPAALEALAQIRTPMDLLLCDGQGLAHPRRFGLACHLGLLADLPAIGVAKSRLVGDFEPVGEERGRWQPLWHRGEMVGAVLRTRDGVRPLFVSVGHRISLETAIAYTLRCAPRYRLPETTRQADRLAAGGAKNGVT